MRALTSQLLRRVWAAVPTPWTVDLELDEGVLEENIRRYEAAGVPGVYTTDSDGEFYAIELNEFRKLATAFGRALARTSLDAAMGVTWSHTGGITNRIKACLDAGIPNVHVAFPFWMPLAKSDVPRFFEDLARAAPEARWIHYASSHSHIQLSGAEYAHYQTKYPDQFIGTKLGINDIAQITETLAGAPHLSHFSGGDYSYVYAALAGIRGVYSYWVNTLPTWTLETWRLCEERSWEEAARRQTKLVRWETEFVKRLRQLGHSHGIIGKARAALTGFLVDNGVTKPPYYPVDAAILKELKKDFDRFWEEEKSYERHAP